jgi:trehalose synthase-fused probable maltokinase
MAGILQQFVRNQGDAWKYTLESLTVFFDRTLAAKQTAPALRSNHALDLAAEKPSQQIRELLGSYTDSAHLLGVRTAEMHGALADPQGGPDFEPEQFSYGDGQRLHDEVLAQADIALELLRRKLAVLSGAAAEDAQVLLRMEHRVTERFASLREHAVAAARIRLHGDYHLGQVLYTGADFMIIDFEGEPAHPLSARRDKGLAMRDVAGMVRSFQYAAYSALFEQMGRVPLDSEMQETAEGWAAFWTAWISATYLQAYFDTAGECAFVPAQKEERRLLLDVFLLQKALYELAYEINNRPDWVRIPLRGILNLVS